MCDSSGAAALPLAGIRSQPHDNLHMLLMVLGEHLRTCGTNTAALRREPATLAARIVFEDPAPA